MLKHTHYLNCPDIDFDAFSEFMAGNSSNFRCKGCTKIQFMPSERHNTELIAFVANLPDPVIAIDLKGSVVSTGKPRCTQPIWQARRRSYWRIRSRPSKFIALTLVAIEGEATRHREALCWTVDSPQLNPGTYLSGWRRQRTCACEQVRRRFVLATKRWIRPMIPEQVSNLGFEHFVGVSNRHKALISRFQKLAMLDQPLLIEGDTGTGKEMLAKACQQPLKPLVFPIFDLSVHRCLMT